MATKSSCNSGVCGMAEEVERAEQSGAIRNSLDVEIRYGRNYQLANL